MTAVAVDGCGAPLLSCSLAGLARAFRSLAVAEDGPERRVADAIRRYPEWVSGTTRDELALLKAVPGAIGKAGAESCYAVALPDGRSFALKVDDGAARVRPVLMAAALERAGIDREPGSTVRRCGVPVSCRCLVVGSLWASCGPASRPGFVARAMAPRASTSGRRSPVNRVTLAEFAFC